MFERTGKPRRSIHYGGRNDGPSIGTVVGDVGASVGTGTGGIVEDTPARMILGPDTPAGQSLLVAGIGLAVLFVAVGGEGGLPGRAARSLSFIAIVASATMVIGWAARNYAGQYPDYPLAQGIAFNL